MAADVLFVGGAANNPSPVGRGISAPPPRTYPSRPRQAGHGLRQAAAGFGGQQWVVGSSGQWQVAGFGGSRAPAGRGLL